METIDDVLRRIVREEIAQQLANETVRVERQVVEVNPQRLYSVASVAKLLEVSTDYIYGRIHAADLAVVELGQGRAKQRISVGELERFIRERTFGGVLPMT